MRYLYPFFRKNSAISFKLFAENFRNNFKYLGWFKPPTPTSFKKPKPGLHETHMPTLQPDLLLFTYISMFFYLNV